MQAPAGERTVAEKESAALDRITWIQRRFPLGRLPHAPRLGYRLGMRFEDLDEREQAWARDHEQLWQRAHAIVLTHPHLDVSLVYHTLVNMRRTPEERLARGLVRGTARRAAPIRETAIAVRDEAKREP